LNGFFEQVLVIKSAHIPRQLLLAGFRLLYNEMAWSYDLVSWVVSLGQWRDWQRAAIPYLQGSRVLELAHGPGHMLIALSEAGYQVIGYDLSSYMGRQAAKRVARANLEVPLIRGKAQNIPFSYDVFDSILATFPTEFIKDPDTILSILSILKPGGRLVIVPEARLIGGGVIHSLIEWLYTITGQRQVPMKTSSQPLDWRSIGEYYASSGFRVHVHSVLLDRSEVTIVVAERT
jgi:ubiquinone/menaquinone biosynthesis C-methylase UbiE